jgi:Ca-activated chloride channel family protein
VFVSVTGEKGAPVTNLTRSDFAVRENGKAQEVLEATRAVFVPLLLGVVVDTSGSAHVAMRSEDQSRALYGFLDESLRSSDAAFLMAAGQENDIVTDVTNNPAALLRGLEGLAAANRWGSAAIWDAIDLCLLAGLPGTSARRVVIVVSDFQDNGSRQTLDETILEAQRTGTTVFALMEPGILASKGESNRAKHNAERIAGETGGALFVVSSSRELAVSLEDIRLLLQSSYVIRYQPTTDPVGLQPAELRIRVSRRRCTVLAPARRASSP